MLPTTGIASSQHNTPLLGENLSPHGTSESHRQTIRESVNDLPHDSSKLVHITAFALDSSTLSSTMNKSPLGDLPPELRNEVYELTFSDCAAVRLQFHEDETRIRDFSLSPACQRDTHPLALLCTCKQVMDEAKSVAWDRMCFVIHSRLESAPLAFAAFTPKFDGDKAHSVSHLQIDFGEVRDLRLDYEGKTQFETSLTELWEKSRAIDFLSLSVSFQILPGLSGEPSELRLEMNDKKAFILSVVDCKAEMDRLRDVGAVVGTASMIDLGIIDAIDFSLRFFVLWLSSPVIKKGPAN